MIVGTVIDDSLEGSRELQLLLQELTKDFNYRCSNHSINSNIHENNLNQENLKIQEVDTNSDSIIDDNDIPAF